VYVGEDIFGIKWRNWKLLTKEFDDGKGTGKIVQYGIPRIYNLYNDPQELYPVTMKSADHLWVRWPMADIMLEHLESLQHEPPIKPGTPDPYVPPKGQ
jgi:arylsulfatase